MSSTTVEKDDENSPKRVGCKFVQCRCMSTKVQEFDFEETFGKIMFCPWNGYTWVCWCSWTQTAGQSHTQALTLSFSITVYRAGDNILELSLYHSIKLFF